jgi:hypothetical protein
VVLGTILRGLVEGGTRASSQEEMVSAVEASCAELAGSTLAAAQEWVAGSLADIERFAARIPPADGRAVVNAVYVAVCDAVGPVATDKILARAVEAAEKLDAAGQCPPRSLL